jgi:hypothetical protein
VEIRPLILSPTPTCTPTITPKATELPYPVISPPPGLDYRTEEGLWRVNASGERELLLKIAEDEDGWLSPDGKYILLFDYNTIEWYSKWYLNRPDLFIIPTGSYSKIQLVPSGTDRFCEARWVDRPRMIVIVILESEDRFGYDCSGRTAYYTLDGKIHLLSNDEGWGRPDNSPNGRTIAFDKLGMPWLYHWETGATPFDWKAYKFPASEIGSMADPSWSPSGNLLAWTVDGVVEGETQFGIGIFDMRERTSRFLYPYDTREFEGSRTDIAWSSDENYISITRHAGDIFFVLSVDGTSHYKQLVEGNDWSPIDPWYSQLNRSDENGPWELRIETPGGGLVHKQEIPSISGKEIYDYWSSEGKYLVIAYYNYGEPGDILLALETASWKLSQVDLPEDSSFAFWP